MHIAWPKPSRRVSMVLAVVGILALIISSISFVVQTARTQTVQTTINMAEGDRLVIECVNAFIEHEYTIDPGYADLECSVSAPLPTEEPTATPTDVPPTATPTEPSPTATPLPTDVGEWHTPTDHEHGDAPPQWVTDFSMAQFGHGVIYGGDEQTPGEFVKKPHAFKGFSATLNGVEVYLRHHSQTNPAGRARFHSFELYLRDRSGNISFIQGWVDYGEGNQAGPNIRDKTCEADTRPVIGVNYLACGPFHFEDWYTNDGGTYDASQWGPDMGFNLQATAYNEGSATDYSTWTPAPDGNFGLTRRMELAWYPGRADYVFNQYGGDYDTWFWTDQWLRPVSGPNDPVCGTTNTIGGVAYEVHCLPQYVSSTLPEISFPGNSSQKTFPGSPNLALPN